MLTSSNRLSTKSPELTSRISSSRILLSANCVKSLSSRHDSATPPRLRYLRAHLDLASTTHSWVRQLSLVAPQANHSLCLWDLIQRSKFSTPSPPFAEASPASLPRKTAMSLPVRLQLQIPRTTPPLNLQCSIKSPCPKMNASELRSHPHVA